MNEITDIVVGFLLVTSWGTLCGFLVTVTIVGFGASIYHRFIKKEPDEGDALAIFWTSCGSLILAFLGTLLWLKFSEFKYLIEVFYGFSIFYFLFLGLIFFFGVWIYDISYNFLEELAYPVE